MQRLARSAQHDYQTRARRGAAVRGRCRYNGVSLDRDGGSLRLHSPGLHPRAREYTQRSLARHSFSTLVTLTLAAALQVRLRTVYRLS